MICLDDEPFAIVNRLGFIRLMANLVPNYCIPSTHYFTELLPSEFEACKTSIKALLETAGDVSFTTDLWTAKNSTTSHMALTGITALNQLRTSNYMSISLSVGCTFLIAEFKPNFHQCPCPMYATDAVVYTNWFQ